MFLVGLTGGIATGKSTVAALLQEKGVHVIDADKIAREVVQPGRTAWKKIKTTFGQDVLTPSGELNRAKLGKIIFSNPDERKKLNQITHPEIYKVIFWRCFKLLLTGCQFVVLDLPLLYESGKMVPYMTKVIVVTCDAEQQISRLMKRNDLSVHEAEARISAQFPLEDKCYYADFVIDNSHSFEETKLQVEAAVREVQKSHAHWKLRFIFWGTVTVLGGCVIFSLWRLLKH